MGGGFACRGFEWAGNGGICKGLDRGRAKVRGVQNWLKGGRPNRDKNGARNRWVWLPFEGKMWTVRT